MWQMLQNSTRNKRLQEAPFLANWLTKEVQNLETLACRLRTLTA